MNRGLKPILAIVVLDAMGIGIVFPTLPALLRVLLHGGGDVARHYGYLLAAYAVTMLFASPALACLAIVSAGARCCYFRWPARRLTIW